MTSSEISQTIETYFNTNWIATPIAWPNVPFTIPNDSWVRFNNLPDMIETDEIGLGATGIRLGVVKIQIFTLPNIGSRTGADLADMVEALFHLQDIGNVKIKNAYTTNNGLNDDGTWYQFTVTAQWWVFINE